MGNTADLDLAIIARYLVAVTGPPAFIGQALRICLYTGFSRTIPGASIPV